MKNYENAHYIKFSAEDVCDIIFKDVVIDLVRNRFVSGSISIEGKEYDMSKINEELTTVFAKVVDTGIYELLDNDMNTIYVSEGYVPTLFDYWTSDCNYGDYISFKIEDNNTLWHRSIGSLSSFNNDDDWRQI